MPMKSRRNLSIASALSASARSAAMLGAFSLTGCAALCSIGSTAHHDKTPAAATKSQPASHRPPMPFPEEPGDDSESPLPQTVNVFGEVNGAAPRSSTLGG